MKRKIVSVADDQISADEDEDSSICHDVCNEDEFTISTLADVEVESVPRWIRYMPKSKVTSSVNNSDQGAPNVDDNNLLATDKKAVKVSRKKSLNPFTTEAVYTSHFEGIKQSKDSTTICSVEEEVNLNDASPWISEDFAPSSQEPDRKRRIVGKYITNTVCEATELISMFRLERK